MSSLSFDPHPPGQVVRNDNEGVNVILALHLASSSAPALPPAAPSRRPEPSRAARAPGMDSLMSRYGLLAPSAPVPDETASAPTRAKPANPFVRK